MTDKVLEYAKAIVAAIAAAAVAALAGVDWYEVVAAAAGGGLLTGVVPNKDPGPDTAVGKAPLKSS